MDGTPPLPGRDHFLVNQISVIQECSICQNDFDKNEHAPARLCGLNSCHHVFGASCLKQWLVSHMPGANKCPMCRKELFVSENGEYESDNEEALAGTLDDDESEEDSDDSIDLADFVNGLGGQEMDKDGDVIRALDEDESGEEGGEQQWSALFAHEDPKIIHARGIRPSYESSGDDENEPAGFLDDELMTDSDAMEEDDTINDSDQTGQAGALPEGVQEDEDLLPEREPRLLRETEGYYDEEIGPTH